MTAPTRLQGVFDPAALSSTVLYDTLETVPELHPGLLATRTYAQMRRDSRLAAIVAGYTMQIRRASWQLEPGGCRPDVVAVVADDVGLPVAGDDKPTAARTRGVSWNEHLRTAMLSLPFGFSTFELLAQLVDGKARLTALSPRLPSTIEMIHADPQTGELLGVSQQLPLDNATPQIKADRIAHYVHDPEGTLAGTSLLRPSYAPWYLKQELMRVHATSARRFGMGVPTVEWANGSLPTPTQIQQAQQLASAARVGETSGASLPPGASLVLRGLSGGVPDVLSYIKWLDQQMAGASLMPHLDLGLSESGSRALGTAFIDSWVLSLGSVAEELCDVATRQVAARLVAWNWGTDEQVPRVVASGVGSQRDVTAASLQQLLSSGALSADPGLEAWVRREYRLPEREEMAKPAPSVQGDTLAVANRKPPPTQPPAPAQPPVRAAVPAADDDPLPAATDDLLAQWPSIAEPMVNDLADQAGRAVTSGKLGLLGSIAVSTVAVAAVAAALGAAMSALAATVATALVTGGRKAPADAGAEQVSQLAQATAGILAGVYASSAARTAMQRPGATASEVAAAVRAGLESLSTAQSGLVAEHLSAALYMTEGAALIAVCEKYPPKRLIADEHRDPNTCPECLASDGMEFDSLADALTVYSNGAQNSGCSGKSRCRGRLIPKWS